jgi:enediyne biosynthesis protein E7
MATVHSSDLHTERNTPRSGHPVSRLPGPPWYTAMENTSNFLRHAIDSSEAMRQQYGDVVSVPTLVGRLTLVFHPDGVRRILQEDHFNYNKDIPDYHVLSLLLGKGLLTNDGESWLQQRRLIQPAFHRDRIAAFSKVMTDTTLEWLDRWEIQGLVDTGKPLDMLTEMSGLTLTIVCKALFGADLRDDQLKRVGRALTTANHRLSDAFYIPAILSLPTPQRHQLSAARRELHAIVDELVRQRRADPGERNDLLSMLLEARDADTGEGMSESQIRDEVLTLLLAGHETTANTLSWTFYLLARHPEVAAALHDEYRGVLAGHTPAMNDLAQLPYGRMVVEESMRLYPPAWSVGRHALAEDEIGGYVIPKGAYVLLFQSVTHRHPDFWEQSNAFDPQRFSSERAAGRHKYAYFPFGGGPRLCIGNQFALTEAQLILATILSRFQMRLTPNATVVPEPLVTLRPRGILQMTLHSSAA